MSRLMLSMTLGLVVGLSAYGSADDPTQNPAADNTVDCAAPTPDDLEVCVAQRREAWAQRGIVGMLMHPEAGDEEGGRWRVKRLAPHGAAEEAEIRPDDVVVVWGDERVPASATDMDQVLEAVRVGEPIALVIEREGVERRFELQARPATAEQVDYWLLTYVHQHFPPAVFEQFEATMGQGLERAGQRR